MNQTFSRENDGEQSKSHWFDEKYFYNKNTKSNLTLLCFGVLSRIHQMFSPIWFTNLIHECFSVWKVEKENKFLIDPKRFFSQFFSWKRNHNKYFLKEFVDTKFKIGETIWWIRYVFILKSWWTMIYFKVNSVQEACAKCFAVHILKFEILHTTWKNQYM